MYLFEYNDNEKKIGDSFRGAMLEFVFKILKGKQNQDWMWFLLLIVSQCCWYAGIIIIIIIIFIIIIIKGVDCQVGI